MKQSVVDALRRALASARGLLCYASLVAIGLVLAALCLDASAAPVELDDLTSLPSSEGPEPDTSESPDVSDEVAAHATVIIAPAATTAITHVITRGGGRTGYRSRIPRPSGT